MLALTVLEGGGGLEAGRAYRVLLLAAVDVADGEADGGQGLAAGEGRPHRVLLLEGEPLLWVVVLVDGGDAALQLGDAPAAVTEAHVVGGHGGEVGAGHALHVVGPHAVGQGSGRGLVVVVVSGLVLALLLLLLLLLAGGELLLGGCGPGAARVEVADAVAVVELRVAGGGGRGDVVVPRVALAGGGGYGCSGGRVLDGHDVHAGGAVVLGVGARAVGFGGGGPRVLEAVGLLQLLGRLEHEVDAVGALVVDAAAADRLREVHYHGPGHARQVAQVALRAFSHHFASCLLSIRYMLFT